MNYKTISKPKFKLIDCTLNKNISHNKSSNYLLNLSNYFTKAWQFISNLTSTKATSVYDKNVIDFNHNDRVYNITDTTELRLIASRRTFM